MGEGIDKGRNIGKVNGRGEGKGREGSGLKSRALKRVKRGIGEGGK